MLYKESGLSSSLATLGVALAVLGLPIFMLAGFAFGLCGQ